MELSIVDVIQHETFRYKNYDPRAQQMKKLCHQVLRDLDVLDPSCAPGVSHHEPGGLTTRQALDAVHALAALQARGAVNLIGADVVELNPRRDPSGITAMTAAKIVKELMGLLHDADARFSR